LFPEAAKLAIYKNHNVAISISSSDCSNSTIKEGEEKPWASFGDGELNSDTDHAALVKQRLRIDH
jgi:hypothetical protein